MLDVSSVFNYSEHYILVQCFAEHICASQSPIKRNYKMFEMEGASDISDSRCTSSIYMRKPKPTIPDTSSPNSWVLELSSAGEIYPALNLLHQFDTQMVIGPCSENKQEGKVRESTE